jgi:predicted GNAT family acetyltransferase
MDTLLSHLSRSIAVATLRATVWCGDRAAMPEATLDPLASTAERLRPMTGESEEPIMEPTTTQSFAIEHEEANGRGAFFVARDGEHVAEMTYTRTDASSIIVDHTEVGDSLRGLGVARKLLDALVGWARSTRTGVRATCPYARAQFEKDASIRDVYLG